MRAFIVLLTIAACAFALPINEKDDMFDLLSENGGLFEMFNPNNRIVGGAATTIERFPWTVSMQFAGGHRCGASIIRVNRILTAAHCVNNIAPHTLSVRAGSTQSASGGQLVQVTHIINHPQYVHGRLINDISIFWLGGNLNIALAGIAVIPLPPQNAGVAVGALASVTGWGHQQEGGSNSPGLRFVDVPIVAQATCNAQYGGSITADMLCAGFPQGGRDACQNDSGGPLSLNGQIVGVVSWGNGCARPNFAGVYARVSFFTNWILANI